MTAPRIYVGGAVGRYFEPDHVGSIMRMARRPEVVRYAPRFNDAAIDRARSQCATDFLASDADVLLQVDSDIVFDPDAAVLICTQAMEHDVVGGLYVTRAVGAYSRPTSYLVNDQRYEFGNDPTPVPIRYLAGGFVAVHRRVYEALAQQPDMPLLNPHEPHGKFYPFYLPMWTDGEDGSPMYLSEDWAFCHRAREAGFSVMLNQAVRLLHLGQYAYHLEDVVTEAAPYGTFVALTRQAGGLYRKEGMAPAAPDRETQERLARLNARLARTNGRT